MKKTFELFSEKERKILGLLLAIFIFGFIFYFFIALGEKRTCLHAMSSLSIKTKELQKIDSSKGLKKQEWLNWKAAQEDIATARQYFYSEKNAFAELRQDLSRILRESGLPVPRIQYNYAEFEDENINKVQLDFNISVSYFSLKKIINSLEGLPKFLVIEKINFLDIGPQTGFLKLRIILAGYYES